MRNARHAFVLLCLLLSIEGCRGGRSGEEGEAGKPRPATLIPPASRIAPAPEPRPVTRPLLLLGLDGATWKLLDPLLAEGVLPNFARLIAHGSRAPLKTFEPTLSPLIWTSIATGTGPIAHGIQDFVAPVPGTGEKAIVTSNMRRVKALWNILSDRGTTVGVVGWWATYPAEKVNGFVISDQANALRRDNYRLAARLPVDAKPRPAADPSAVWPPELAAEVADALELDPRITRAELRRFFELPAKRGDLLSAHVGNDEDILSVFKFSYLIDKSFVGAGLRAIEKHKPTFAAMYLNGLDAAEHHFWRFMQPQAFRGVPAGDVARYGNVIRNYYIYMDEVLGRLLALYPLESSTVVVVSDHGHEPNAGFDPKSADHFDRVCSGTHEEAPDGVFIIAGADVAVGARVGRARVVDVAPTVLALMGAPIGLDVPGRVIDGVIASEFFAVHPLRTVPSHSAGYAHTDAPIRSPMNDALKEKLRGLGYIE
jgi:hypothetical protein